MYNVWCSLTLLILYHFLFFSSPVRCIESNSVENWVITSSWRHSGWMNLGNHGRWKNNISFYCHLSVDPQRGMSQMSRVPSFKWGARIEVAERMAGEKDRKDTQFCSFSRLAFWIILIFCLCFSLWYFF